MAAESNRIVSLQILRFIAAAMVTVLHTRYLDHALTGAPYGGSWFDAAGIGDAGVDIFFVLSGFVIATTGPLAQPQPSGALFFWRRWRRVAPVYFIISVPIIVNSLRISPFAPHRLAATLLFWPVSAAGPVYPYLEPGWTLCFEMAFYTLVALALAGGVLRRNLACWPSPPPASSRGAFSVRPVGSASWSIRCFLNSPSASPLRVGRPPSVGSASDSGSVCSPSERAPTCSRFCWASAT